MKKTDESQRKKTKNKNKEYEKGEKRRILRRKNQGRGKKHEKKLKKKPTKEEEAEEEESEKKDKKRKPSLSSFLLTPFTSRNKPMSPKTFIPGARRTQPLLSLPYPPSVQLCKILSLPITLQGTSKRELFLI